jgi:hypothetical protein
MDTVLGQVNCPRPDRCHCLEGSLQLPFLKAFTIADSLRPRPGPIADSLCPRICNPLNGNDLNRGQPSTGSLRGRIVPGGWVEVVRARGRSCKPADLAEGASPRSGGGRGAGFPRLPPAVIAPWTLATPEAGSNFQRAKQSGSDKRPPFLRAIVPLHPTLRTRAVHGLPNRRGLRCKSYCLMHFRFPAWDEANSTAVGHRVNDNCLVCPLELVNEF